MSEQQLSPAPETAATTTESGPTASSGARGAKSWRRLLVPVGVILLILLSGGLGYCFASGSVPVPPLSWWAGPLFWTVLLVAVLVYRFRDKRQPKPVETTVEIPPKEVPQGKKRRRVAAVLGIVGGLAVVGGVGYLIWQGNIQFSNIPPWVWPTLFGVVLVAGLAPPILRSLPKRQPKPVEPPTEEPPSRPQRFNKRNVIVAGMLCVGCLFAGLIGYVFSQGTFRLSALPWWIGPSFWCAVIAAALTPSAWKMFATGQLSTESLGKSIADKKVTKTLWTVAALLVIALAAIGVFIAVFFPGAIRLPGLAWWNGIAFWSMVVAAITTPRIYLSLPKTGWQTGTTAKQIVSQGAGSTTWLLLIGALFLVNAVLIRNPESQDAFVSDALRLFDTRFFTPWQWAFFVLGVGGFFVRYLLETRLMVAELSEKPSDNVFFGYHLATICGSTFTAAFLCSKFSLVSTVIGLPFQPNFPVRYWSIIWIVLTAEIVFFLGLKHHFFDDITGRFSGSPSFSLRRSPLLIGVGITALVLVGIGGVVAWNTVKFSELPWWTAPAFWTFVIAAALSPKFLKALPPRPATFALRDKNKPTIRFGFNRWTLVYAVLLVCVFGAISGIGYVFASGKVKYSELPSWTMPAFWTTIIVAGVSYRVIESVRAYLKETATRRQLQRKTKPQTVARPGAFSTSKTSDQSARFEFGPNLWIGVAAVVGVSLLGYFCYSLLTMQSLDADGHPVALSWWVWPSFLLLVISAAIAYPLFQSLRENFASASKPTIAPKAAKPVGFNTAVKQKSVPKASGGSWQLPSMPQFEGFRELFPMIGIGVVALIGLIIFGYIIYSVSTMERIDADGHPMPMPSWIVPLLCILVALGAVGYKLYSALSEDSGGAFRSSTIRPTAAKSGKPVGFNAAGFGKKNAGFNLSQGGDDWYANPLIWLGILGGVVGVLLLVIIFMLVF